jgi:murein DD-endopeptidase MepM/ murein hydrolase activator NlpD
MLVVAFVVLCAGVFAVAQRQDATSRDDAPEAHVAATRTEVEAADAELLLAAPEPSFASEIATDTPSVERELRVLEGTLARGETLGQALHRNGVSNAMVHGVTRAMGKLYDFRKARPGHRYQLSLDAEGSLVEFRYETSPIESYTVSHDGEAFMSRREEPPTRKEVARIAGVVSSNLHDAVMGLGESAQLAVDLADIFAWDIDFTRSVRFGDEFRVLYERLYRGDVRGGESYVGPGRILAARYSGAAGDHAAVYFESGQGRGGYYRPDGSSVERNFLMAPVRHTRIASAFSNSRLHPILGIWRPHHGIDYAAPEGTPIWAVADGTIIHRGRSGGFGNLVKIRHADGYVSYYGHLSRFASGMVEGNRVRQKQVIGYVGHTGLATGPHVCFRMSKDGRFVDPARLRLPGGAPLTPALRATFESSADLLLARLDATAPLVEVDEAL